MNNVGIFLSFLKKLQDEIPKENMKSEEDCREN